MAHTPCIYICHTHESTVIQKMHLLFGMKEVGCPGAGGGGGGGTPPGNGGGRGGGGGGWV